MKRTLRLIALAVLASGIAHAGNGKLKVVLLAGQSNMQGQAADYTLKNAIENDATKKGLTHLMKGGEFVVRDDVWCTFLGQGGPEGSEPPSGPLTVGFGGFKTRDGGEGEPKKVPVKSLGPELGIGHVLGEHYDEPVLLIKAAWGGKSLKHNFRSPSSMPAEEQIKDQYQAVVNRHNERKATYEDYLARKAKGEQLRKAKMPGELISYEDYKKSIGPYYHQMIGEFNKVLGDLKTHVPSYDEDKGHEIIGMVWFQGWNDGIGTGNPEYGKQLAAFIRDVRKDMKVPNMPFVIGELGTDGEAPELEWITNFRKQQQIPAQMPEFKGNVSFVKTSHLWPVNPHKDDGTTWIKYQAEKTKAKEARKNGGKFDRKAIEKKYWLDTPIGRYSSTMFSDKRFHYQGSGRCYYLMGEAMGESLVGMMAEK